MSRPDTNSVWYDSGQNAMFCREEGCEASDAIYCVANKKCPSNLFRYKGACVEKCPSGTRDNGHRLCEEPRDPVCEYMFKGLYWAPQRKCELTESMLDDLFQNELCRESDGCVIYINNQYN